MEVRKKEALTPALREERPLAKVERKIVRHIHERRRPKEKEKERSVSFAISAGAVVVLAILIVGGIYFAKRRTLPPEPPPAPEPVIREVFKFLPAPTPTVEPKPELKAEPKAIAKAEPPPLPPPPPRGPWTGFWRSEKAKASLRLSQSKDGVTGFYSPPNAMYAPGDIQAAEVKGDALTWSVVLGTRRFGMRAERNGDSMIVWKWVDIDGLRDEYRLVEAAFLRRQINAYQALAARQQIQAALKTAGPEHEKELGVFVREDAPQMRTKR